MCFSIYGISTPHFIVPERDDDDKRTTRHVNDAYKSVVCPPQLNVHQVAVGLLLVTTLINQTLQNQGQSRDIESGTTAIEIISLGSTLQTADHHL